MPRRNLEGNLSSDKRITGGAHGTYGVLQDNEFWSIARVSILRNTSGREVESMGHTSKSDNEIKEQVLNELKWECRVGALPITVEVENGLVTLSGVVRTYVNKLAAERAVHEVAGVIDLANELQVRPTGALVQTDSDIAKAVRHSLEWHPLVPDDQIRSTVSDGWVTLEGQVEYFRQSEDAQHAVSQLKGVVGVINKLTLRPREIFPGDLRESIEEALNRRTQREVDRMQIKVEHGNVELSGRVHSLQEKRAVLGSVSHVPGVVTVTEHLTVDPCS